MQSPSNLTKKFKRQAAPKIADAIQYLDRIAQSAAKEKPYNQFGKYVAAELRQLPQHQAILLQQEIQNCITLARLSFLETMHSHRTQTLIVDDISPSHLQLLQMHLLLLLLATILIFYSKQLLIHLLWITNTVYNFCHIIL